MNKRLKQLRKDKGVTQKTVAKAIGVTESAYANYEQGTREPGIDVIIRICQYFSVTSDYLLGLKEI